MEEKNIIYKQVCGKRYKRGKEREKQEQESKLVTKEDKSERENEGPKDRGGRQGKEVVVGETDGGWREKGHKNQ